MDPKDMIIYSDMDGTLLSSWDLGPIVGEKNIKAINRWLKLGGSFSIATGRNLKNVSYFLKFINVNCPLVLLNGAMIYSRRKNKIYYKELIPKSFLDEAILYFRSNKRVALVISSEKDHYSLIHKDSRKIPKLDFVTKEVFFEKLKYINILKVTFVVLDEDSEKVISDIKNFNSIEEVNLVPSSKRFIELVSVKTSKALGIKRAIQDINKKIVCIGDYLNDLEMLKIADISACPQNSHEEIKKNADIITVNNNEGAIADLINQLLKR